MLGGEVLGAITAGCMCPFVRRTNKNEITTGEIPMLVLNVRFRTSAGALDQVEPADI